MELSRDDVLKLAKLSRLKLSEEEIEQYRRELSASLEYVRVLDKVDTSGVAPTYQVTGLSTVDENTTREDIINEQVTHQELMENVPEAQGRYIKVKRMIG